MAQLPHGRHGLPQEFVEHNQRERLIAAFTELVGEVGYNEVTISATTAGAAVSSRTFYTFFATIEECFLGAFEVALERLGPPLLEAFESEDEWPRGVRAGLARGLSLLSSDPATARLLTAEPFVAGSAVAERYKTALEAVTPYLRAGRKLRPEGAPDLPESTERGLLGAINGLVARKVNAGGASDLLDLLPDLTQFVLTPYLGAAAARELATETMAHP
ncbi:MAG TPA: TetR/AcrR family transcriptional regulator [Solirubrobacterales bacterium]|nr:TetR/AcrR family transcriptional regulator [Solirubrobacterales bacterium]